MTPPNTSMNKSSMLQDIEKGRITEVDAINGSIGEIARQMKLEAPLNAALQKLVKSASADRNRQTLTPAHLAEMLGLSRA